MSRLRFFACACLLAACGGKKDGPTTDEKPLAVADAAPALPTLVPQPLGVDNPGAFGYSYGKGEKEWKKGEAAIKARDWPAIAAAADATLAKDPGHMDALRWLAVARAQQKQYDAVGEPLAKVLALDWVRFGPGLANDKDLADFLASPEGKAVSELAGRYRDDFESRAAKGLWLVARRGSFRPPKPGVQPSPNRAELFAFDQETRRYLRLTDTGWRVAGFLPAPSGEQVALVLVHKISVPPDFAASNPIYLEEVRVRTLPLPLSSAPVDPPRKDAVFKKATRGVIVSWDVGDRLVVTTATAKNRWELGQETPFAVDPATGQAKPAKQRPVGSRDLIVTWDDVQVSAPTDAGVVEADWGERDAAASFRIPQTQKTITLPAGQLAARESVVASPSKARLAFATYADPCAEKEGDQLASLFLVDAATGKLKHLGDGRGPMAGRFLGEDWLVYEDDSGGIRLVDAAQGKETLRLQSKGGMALHGVGAAPLGTALCKKEKVVYETPPEGELPPEGEMPPEAP